jgi:hypothetical protein
VFHCSGIDWNRALQRHNPGTLASPVQTLADEEKGVVPSLDELVAEQRKRAEESTPESRCALLKSSLTWTKNYTKERRQ